MDNHQFEQHLDLAKLAAETFPNVHEITDISTSVVKLSEINAEIKHNKKLCNEIIDDTLAKAHVIIQSSLQMLEMAIKGKIINEMLKVLSDFGILMQEIHEEVKAHTKLITRSKKILYEYQEKIRNYNVENLTTIIHSISENEEEQPMEQAGAVEIPLDMPMQLPEVVTYTARSAPVLPGVIAPQRSLQKKRYYVVVVGKSTGIYYDEWDNVQCLIHRVSGACYKGFSTHQQAEQYYIDSKYMGKVRVVRDPGDEEIYGPSQSAIQ